MVGCDPEFFLVDGTKVIPAVKVFGRAKRTGAGYVCHDGFVAELNPYPCVTGNELAQNINSLKHFVNDMGYDTLFTAAMDIPKEEIELAGQIDATALQFGCNPDKSAYGLAASYRGDASNIEMRCCGGHIHLDTPRGADHDSIIQILDRTVGLVINGPKEDEIKRREFYGRAGTYRSKPFGVEWRVPSSWLFSLPVGDMAKIFDFAMFVVNNYESIKPLVSTEEAIEIINSGEQHEKGWDLWKS